MSDQPRNASIMAGPGIMLLSAAIFGYFGFAMGWVHTSATTGQVVPFVPLLEWTLKGTAIVFLLSAVLTFWRPRAGNLLYAASGLLSAALFVVVAIMDWMDPQHSAFSPVILLLFAAWNGFGSWGALRDLRG